MSSTEKIYAKHMDFINCVSSVCNDLEGDKPAFTRLFNKHKHKLTAEQRAEVEQYLQTVQAKWFRGRTPKTNIECGIALLSTLDIISGVLPRVVKDAWFESRTQAAKVFGVDQFYDSESL